MSLPQVHVLPPITGAMWLVLPNSSFVLFISLGHNCFAWSFLGRWSQMSTYSKQGPSSRQRMAPPKSSLTTQWVSWSYRNMGEGLLTRAWVAQRRLWEPHPLQVMSQGSRITWVTCAAWRQRCLSFFFPISGSLLVQPWKGALETCSFLRFLNRISSIYFQSLKIPQKNVPVLREQLHTILEV